MKKFNKDKLWFTSDLHCYHKNICKYCNRPFDSVESMNSALIKRWNSLIKDDDDVFMLGDVVFGRYEKWVEIISQLKGNKHLIIGNHDPENVVNKLCEEGYFKSVSQMKLIKVEDQELFLCHYPMIEWPNKERGSLMLHGHVHSTEDTPSFSEYHYDVGMDHNAWFPVSYVELKEKIKICE